MICGLEIWPSGKPTLKLLQSSTISRSVSCCPLGDCCYAIKRNCKGTFTPLFANFCTGVLLSFSVSFRCLCFGFLACSASSALIPTDSIKFLRYSGTVPRLSWFRLFLFLSPTCPMTVWSPYNYKLQMLEHSGRTRPAINLIITKNMSITKYTYTVCSTHTKIG